MIGVGTFKEQLLRFNTERWGFLFKDDTEHTGFMAGSIYFIHYWINSPDDVYVKYPIKQVDKFNICRFDVNQHGVYFDSELIEYSSWEEFITNSTLFLDSF